MSSFALRFNINECNFKLLLVFSQAPIQFPRVTDSAAMNALPHPYEKFALKERLAKTERFSGGDNQIVKPAYRALAKYAARVLNGQVGNTLAEDELDHYNVINVYQHLYWLFV